MSQFDVTEYHRPIEPTQAVLYNPYEVTSPYNLHDIPVPPPPPKRGHVGLAVALMSVFCLVVLLASILIAIMRFSAQQSLKAPATLTSIATSERATVQPTPTLPIALIHASDIYMDFTNSAFGSFAYGPRNDANWSCCTYYPDGGAIVWFQGAGGSCSGGCPSMDIATFASFREAQIDATQLNNQGFGTSVVGTCLLSYNQTEDWGIVHGYVQVMQTYCT